MTFQAGQSGNPHGRPKRSRNKQTQAVTDRLEELGCDPIEGMARIAMDERVELSIRAQMYKELAQYVAPKRKAVEMQTDVGFSWIEAICAVQEREKAEKAKGDV